MAIAPRERAEFRHVPYFFSDVFDLSYEFWGDPANAEQIVHRGDMTGNSFSTWPWSTSGWWCRSRGRRGGLAPGLQGADRALEG